MYQAKRKGGAGHQAINSHENTLSNESTSLEQDLRLAFAEGRLEVNYQPIVRSANGIVVGVEASVRWTDPARGQSPPYQ